MIGNQMELNFHPISPIYNLIYKDVHKSTYKCRPYPEERQNITALNEALAAVIAQEARRDIIIPLTHIKCRSNGQIAIDNYESMSIEEHAFHQLATRLGLNIIDCPRGLAGYLTTCPSNLRAENFKYWIEYITNHAYNTSVVLRTRQASGETIRSIYAVVTPTYSICDCDYIADVANSVLSNHPLRGYGYYDGYNFKIRLFNHEEANLFKSGIELSTSDDGGGSIFINHLTYHSNYDAYLQLPKFLAPCVRKIHRGSHELMEDTIYYALNQMAEIQQNFISYLNRAQHDFIAKDWREMKSIIHRLTINRMSVNGKMTSITPIIQVTGMSGQTLAEQLIKRWGDTLGCTTFTRATLFNLLIKFSQSLANEEMRINIEEAAVNILNPKLPLTPMKELNV